MKPNDQRVRANLSGDGGAGFLIRWRGRQEGPFELDMIKAKLHAKHIGLLHEVSRDGQWITLREFLAEQEQERERETRARLAQERRQEEKRVREKEQQRAAQEHQLREAKEQREWENQEARRRENQEAREQEEQEEQDRQQQAQNNRGDHGQEVSWFIFFMFWILFFYYRHLW